MFFRQFERARYHGMEEVIGSIPIRSTNQFNHLEAPPFRDFVASLSQIPKPHQEPASLRSCSHVLQSRWEPSRNSPVPLQRQDSRSPIENFLMPCEARPVQVHPY